MNPQRFLYLGGSVLVTTGVMGVRGVLGSISYAAFFHPPSWINWVHLGIGCMALSVAAHGNRKVQAGITVVPAILGTVLGLAGLLVGPFAAKRFRVPELADPSDHTAHLIVGLLALWGWVRR